MAAATAPTILDGKWVLIETTGKFEEILSEEGLGFFVRKMIMSTTPEATITTTGKTIHMHLHTAMKDRDEELLVTGIQEQKMVDELGQCKITSEACEHPDEHLPSIKTTTEFVGKPYVQTVYRYVKADKLIFDTRLDGKGKNLQGCRIFKKMP
ncbi:hypothetical protein Pelo_5035 [Pelomyxa schiedti]|nr:hypothetical protein Pelo_5035 [Pelomyxa schiedti]